MASISDGEVQALFDRADEAVRKSRVILASMVARKDVHLRTASEHAERRLVEEHQAAVLRAVPPLDG